MNTEAATIRDRPRHPSTRQARERWLGIGLIAPSVVLIVLLILYPFVYNIWMSLQNVSLTQGTTGWAGLNNYLYLFHWDQFWHGMVIDIIWAAASVVGQLILSLVISHLLNASFAGQNLARALIILPWTVSAVVIAFTWRWMLNDLFGIVNLGLLGLGVVHKPVLFFVTPTGALTTVIGINIWRGMPFMTLTLLGGLQSIPREMYEAARTDGANFWQEFLHITLPSLNRIIAILIVLRGIWIFNWFDLMWLTTGGGPDNSTAILPILAYVTGFMSYRMSRAAAIGVMMALVLLVFVIIMSRLMLREDESLA